MSGTQDENPPPPPPPSTQQTPTQQTPHTVSTIKLPILKKGEYDIWAMKMEHYLAHTDYPIWEVIQNGNGPVSVTTDTSGQIKILPPKTGEEIVARERERKARTTLLMAIPEDHLAKFHKMTDAKEMWNAIKSRFGGNDESKKMQKYILKQQFEGFTVSNTDGIHKGYERFQSLLSQLEIHGAKQENKPGMDSLSFDDLYNNLRVFENDVKGSTASTSNLQNVAFVSENTNSTNDVSTAYGVSNTSDQVDEYDLEEMDLKWQVAMISMRIKKFYKKTGRKLQFDAKEPVGFDKTKVECYNCHKTGHFARECRTKEDNRRRDGWNPGNKDGSRTGKKEESRALVTVDGECVDWTAHTEDDENFAFMASNSSGSDTQVCSNECKESYANLKKLYDVQREQLSDASVEIKAYTQGLKKVEAQLVAHQQGQLWYEQKIKFMKIDLDDKTDVLTYHKKLLAKAQKEKDDLEVIVDKWNHSSKNLGKIVNHHMSARDKFGLGYGDYRYSGILSYENEVMQSVFKSNKSDFENLPLHKRLGKTCEMQAVPPPMTGNYLPSGPDIEIDDSQYTYGPEKTQPSESESQTTELDTCNSNISTEPSELVSEPVVNESNIEVQPKVWSDAPIIEEYESDSDDEYVSVQTKGLDTPSFANKQVKTPRENVKNQSTHSQKPKVNNKELGHGFTERACFVCGSFSHLIRDCDYHVKLAKQVELNKQNMSKGNGTGERKPTWNNVQRVNKQNQFVPLAVQTRTGNNPVNTAKASSTNNFSTARQNVNRQTVLTSTALKVNTVKPIVNGVRPANVFHKTHSPSSRPFKRTTVLRTNFSNQKVYTAKVKEVSTVGGKWDTADNPHRTLKNKGIIDSGCSRHMTGNKAYLADFQDFNGGPVAFGGSKGYITGKGKIKTGKLDFEDVSFVKELQHFNLFSVSQMCDKKNKVLFTDSECLVLSPDFKLPDENQILLKVPRQNNMYSFNLENIVPLGGLACLIAKATTDESNHMNRSNARTPQQWSCLRERQDPLLIGEQGHACRFFFLHFLSHLGEAEDVSEIPPLEDIHQDTIDGIFTHILCDEECRADFTIWKTAGEFYQMDVKSAFLYGMIDEEGIMYLQPPGLLRFLSSLRKSTNVVNACMGYIKLPEDVMWNDIILGLQRSLGVMSVRALMKSRFQMSSMGESPFPFLGLKSQETQWIKSKNSLVKHFEDMRLCRPSKEYLQVKLVSMVDDEGRSRHITAIVAGRMRVTSSVRLSVEQHHLPSPAPTRDVPNEALLTNILLKHCVSSIPLRHQHVPFTKSSPIASIPIQSQNLNDPLFECNGLKRDIDSHGNRNAQSDVMDKRNVLDEDKEIIEFSTDGSKLVMMKQVRVTEEILNVSEEQRKQDTERKLTYCWAIKATLLLTMSQAELPSKKKRKSDQRYGIRKIPLRRKVTQESKEEVSEEDKGEENIRKRSTLDYEILDKKYPSLTGDCESWHINQFDESKISEEINECRGTHFWMTDEGLVVSHANREEVSFEKGNTDANAKAKIGVYKRQYYGIGIDTIYQKSFRIPEQTVMVKGTSNPLMAGSLPKT
ncbi:ribonuclease H-like domain-containing protein [Tanacetum coccineum]|uniref:Ribonuclease H-like domain-containing protein n=1 Tax=Tanacetum coccineum TaxID=301880 RepID=A0ABQ4WW48_9ASTR